MPDVLDSVLEWRAARTAAISAANAGQHDLRAEFMRLAAAEAALMDDPAPRARAAESRADARLDRIIVAARSKLDGTS